VVQKDESESDFFHSEILDEVRKLERVEEKRNLDLVRNIVVEGKFEESEWKGG
jgi:hypothetical protein